VKWPIGSIKTTRRKIAINGLTIGKRILALVVPETANVQTILPAQNTEGDHIFREKGRSVNDKCSINLCNNHRDQCEFVGRICKPCYDAGITTGKNSEHTEPFLKRMFAEWDRRRAKEETMTDRFKGLIVALDKDYRDDDAESIIEAIKMVKGVLEVKPVVAKIDDCVIKIRVAEEIEKKLYKALHSYEDD
jgi:hypothetical protein